METKKYKKRLNTREIQNEDPSLKHKYQKEEKKELTVHKSSVLRISGIYSWTVKTVMAIFALIGFVSILRPELRMILAELFVEAYREIRSIG